MKQKVFLFIISVFLNFFVYPQKGIHTGLCLNGGIPVIAAQNTYGFSKLEYDIKTGGSGIIELDALFTKTFGFSFCFGYDRLGSQYKGNIKNINTVREINLDYLNASCLITIIDRNRGNYYFHFGPQLGVLLKASQIYNPAANSLDVDQVHINGRPEENIDITDRFNKMDMRVVLKTGICLDLVDELYIKTGGLVVFSLMDINQDKWKIADRNGKYTESRNIFGGLELGISYSFH